MVRNRKVVRLREWQEAVGVLKDLDSDTGLLKFDRFDVAIPPEHLQRVPELRSLIGRRVALLRTGLPDRPWLIRAVEKLLGDGRDGDETVSEDT